VDTQDEPPTADVLVIFGITGDLARKQTLLALYRLEAHNRLTCKVIGVGRQNWSSEHLIEHARQAIAASGEQIDEAVFARLARRLSYHGGDFDSIDTFQRLASAMSGYAHPLYYLEIPPSLFAPVVDSLATVGLLKGSRVAVEKPFGHDLASARDLNARLRAVLDEDQILRVDHFLGKQPVEELQYLRFANNGLAKLWDRDSISEIHITMAEDFGIEDRGNFYDAVGAVRDVVQNHLLQVLALVAMEPPVGPGADDLNDKKAEVFRAMPALDPERCVRGQYRGYIDVAGVAEDSQTETYIALRTEIDNWRWAGVPIFLRAGKALPERVTEVRMFLHHVPGFSFLPNRRPPEPNQIVLRIDPDPGMRLQLSAQAGNSWHDVHMDSSFAQDLGEAVRPYERLIYAAFTGDRQLFAREDAIEETWRIVQPLLDKPSRIHHYDPGTWGPEAAQSLLHGHRRWQAPWLPQSTHAKQ